MLPYWILFVALAFGALVWSPRTHSVAEGAGQAQTALLNDFILVFTVGVITLMIGLRFRVGSDWPAYAADLRFITARPLASALARSPQEAGYTLLNWITGQLGAGLWLVDLLCAIPFVAGLVAICRQQPNVYLALLVSLPLIIIVVGMGYTRQATALGFLLLGIAALLNSKPFLRFALWTAVGGLFHTSVLIFIPIVAILVLRARMLSIVVLISALVLGYFFILPHAMERYSANYIGRIYEAQGAIFRIALNALAGMTLLALGSRYVRSSMESRIWRSWAVFALLSLPALFIIPSTVIVDRLSVYLLPLQTFVFARLPSVFAGRERPQLWTLVIIVAYAVVLFSWLMFAKNARFWLPYRMYPFV